MESFLAVQAEALLLSLGLGLGLGLAYGLLSPLRHRLKALEWLADLLFCLVAAFMLFLMSMSRPKGRLEVWELLAVFSGFCAYVLLLSPLLSPIFEGALSLAVKARGKITNIFRKTAKFFFPNSK